jgi:hypothetical protein
MNEYEIKTLYKTITKTSEYKQVVDKIDNVKGSLTPKQFLDLQNSLVNASKHENILKNSIIRRLNKKIYEFELENKDSGNEIKNIDTTNKISRSKSMRQNRFKNNKTQRNRKYNKKLSSIIEETDNEKNSRDERKSYKKRLNRSTW